MVAEHISTPCFITGLYILNNQIIRLHSQTTFDSRNFRICQKLPSLTLAAFRSTFYHYVINFSEGSPFTYYKSKASVTNMRKLCCSEIRCRKMLRCREKLPGYGGINRLSTP